MKCVLALDAGGTKCDALLVKTDGEALAMGNHTIPGISGRSRDAITAVAEQVLKPLGVRIDALHVACVDKCSLPTPVFPRLGFGRFELHIFTEFDGPLCLVNAAYGMVVLSGTGALVWIRTRDGREFSLDGMGPLVGDFGSGYYIGSLAIRAATRSTWHPDYKTSLEQAVLRASQVREIIHLNDLTQDRSGVAALAPVVDAEANAGDRMAIQIMEEAAASMVATIRGMVTKSGISSESYAMVGTGGVVMNSKIYWEQVCRLVREFAPGLRPMRCPLPPVAGIALATLLRLGSPDPASLRARLFDTTKVLMQARKQQA
ncbi:MAG: hypothetical protein L6437_04210 [Kiritimatiellae bacterium]|nr:hypothetical protein [Verrucomicrobiota bacterium]MBU4366968.1 hypothetical protein [Verrucomicrobiota bacterium]MCG2659435.1 hypothetical protein [Kiritimatiellia bacterium]